MMSFVLGALYFAIPYREAVTAQSPGLLQPWVQLPLMHSTATRLRPVSGIWFLVFVAATRSGLI
jgi:hypothetical protein